VFASGAVVAMGAAKRVIDGGLDVRLDDGLDLETDAFAEVFRTEDAVTGVRSFLEHGPGKATFLGR
jgi:enoyl-CoA hydratase